MTQSPSPPPLSRRQEILATAGELFRTHGYHATSMRDIARHLDVRGSSLYAHIRSKEELLEEIVAEAADAFLAAAEAVDPTLPPRERLTALIRNHLTVIARELPNATVFFHEWRFLSPSLRARVIARRDAYQHHFHTTITAGTTSGDFTTPDPHLATLFVLSALNWTYQWLNPQGPLDLDTLTTHYTTLILNALGAPPAPTS